MASLFFMRSKLEWAREAYSERNYGRSWYLLFDIIVEGDACPSQKVLNHLEGLCFCAETRRDGFERLGDLAKTAISNIEFAHQERYTREFSP
jgi:hypothetical protein